MHLGHRVRFLRKARGWSQRKLASESRLTPQQISAYERGEYEPSVASQEMLAIAFETDRQGLLFGELSDIARRASQPAADA